MNTPLHPARRFLARFARPHVVLPVSFLNSTAFTIIGLGVVYYLRDTFGARAGAIGLASALFSLLYFFGCFLFRPLTSRILPRYSLILSSVLGAGGIGALLLAPTIVAAIAVYGLLGLSVALFWPPVMGWLSAGVDGQALNREIARFNLAWSAGVIVGPFVAGILTEIGVALPVLVGGGLVVVNAAAIALASAFVGSIREDRYLEPRRRVVRGPDASTPLRFPAWVAVVATYAALGAILVVVPLYGRDVLGLSESRVGLALLLRGLAASTVFLLMGRTNGWHFKAVSFPLPLVGLLAVLVGLSLARSVGALVLLIALGGAFVAVSYTYSVFHGASGSIDRTARMAVHEALLTAGNVAGAAGGGWFYQHGGVDAAFLFCGVVVVAALAVQVVLLVTARRPSSATLATPGPR